MLNRYEEALSACSVVTNLSPEGLATVEFWLRGRDLNPRPLGYEPNELPDCSTPRQKNDPSILTQECATARTLRPLLCGRFCVFHHDEHLAGADEPQLFASDGFDGGRILTQSARRFAQPAVLAAQSLHRGG